MEKQIVVIKLDPLLKLTGHGALSMILAKQLYLENDDEELLFQAVHHRLAGNSSKAISVPTAMKPLNFANLKNFETMNILESEKVYLLRRLKALCLPEVFKEKSNTM